MKPLLATKALRLPYTHEAAAAVRQAYRKCLPVLNWQTFPLSTFHYTIQSQDTHAHDRAGVRSEEEVGSGELLSHLQVVRGVLVVLGVVPEVLEVYDRHSGDHQLQLLLVEDGNEIAGDNLVKSLQEVPQLWLDAVGHLHLAHELNIFPLVLLHHWDIVAAGYEVLGLGLTKLCDLDGWEGGVRGGVNVMSGGGGRV